MSDEDIRPVVRAIKDATVRVGEGSTRWVPSKRYRPREYNGTTPVGSGSERKPLKVTAEPLPAPKPRVDFHIERRMAIVIDGEVRTLSSCCATDCWWSSDPDAHDDPRYVKRHSDKKKHPLEVDDMPVVEPTEDGDGVQLVEADTIQELSMDGLVAAANDGIEFENPEASEIFESGDESDSDEGVQDGE